MNEGFCSAKNTREASLHLTSLSTRYRPVFSSDWRQYTLISLETGLSLQRKNTFYSVVRSDAFRGNIDLLWCSLEFYVSIDVLDLLNLSQDFSWKDWNIRPRPSLIAFQHNVVNQSDSENSSKRMCISVLGPPQVFHFTLPANWWENP